MNQPSALAGSASRCIAAVLLCAAMSVAQAAVTVSLTAPADGSQYTTPANITLSATASASGGYTLSKVEFFYGTTLIGTDTSSPYGIPWNNAPPGQHALTAKATAIKKNSPDDTATSTVVNITVSAPPPQLYFIHADHLATPRLVANAAGTAVWKWDQQEPFGNNVADENPSGLGAFDLPLRLPGQYLDKETNLHYNYFREFDPSTASYVEADPLGIATVWSSTPSTRLNHLYAYVNANPLIYIDPLGLDVRVALYHGAQGAGHVGVGVTGLTQGTFGFYPAPGVEGDPLSGMPGAVLPDNPSNLLREIIIPTTPTQDECVNECIKKRREKPGTYVLTERNCRDFVNDCLVECGIKSSRIRPGPRGFLSRQHRKCTGWQCGGK